MGSACTSESRSPSPVYGRNGVILKRPASVTSVELKMEKMRAEVEQAKAKQQIAENMRRDFEKDRDKMKKVKIVFEKNNHFLWFLKEIQLEFEHEKEVRKAAADKQQRELEKKVELSKTYKPKIFFSTYILRWWRIQIKDNASWLEQTRVQENSGCCEIKV